jgi:hypothetical protein
MWAGLHGLVSLHLAGKLSLGKSAKSLLEPLLDTLFDGNRPKAAQRRRR